MSAEIIDLFDAKMKKNGLKFSFIPSSKGYPAYKDPAAEKPVGVIDSDTSEAQLRAWKNRYAPNEHNKI